MRSRTSYSGLQIAAMLAVAGALLGGCSGPADSRPNIILVITDDQGYGDIGAHGNSKIRTPNLDALHSESVRLTNFHVDPTCSPTRSALVTGRYSSRTGVWHTIMGRSIVHRDERTFADVLSEAGYSTGFFGKWHLGDNAPYRPIDRGFQEAVFHGGGGVGQTPDYWGNDYFDDTYWHNGQPKAYEGYCTDVFFDSALDFIEHQAADGSSPFFVYLSTNAPHGPFLVDETYSTPYADAGVPSPMDKFYGMIENIDDNMGRLVGKLDELGVADNTLLIFMTDNGTAAGVTATHPTQRVGSTNPELLERAAREEAEGAWQGFNAGMRGRKGSEYDGGHRVPFLVRWPQGGLGEPRDVGNLTAHVDVLPTFADLAGIGRREDLDWDGTSLVPLLRGGDWSDRTLVVHSQRIRFPERWRKSAVMTEQYRLVNGAELYDITVDPGQESDIAGESPEVVESLREAYAAWWDRIDERFDTHVYIDIGTDAENPARITAHDWLPPDDSVRVPWNQGHVAAGPAVNGTWKIRVAQAGTYQFDLFQRDKPAGFPIEAATATLTVGGIERTADVPEGSPSVQIEVDLQEGKTTLHTLFRTADGTERGAFYVYARRL
ncbi:MAG: arylsulfatase [Bryobacterales bacterium]|nr:arylsulfatase [Bryobacterales bacterium]